MEVSKWEMCKETAVKPNQTVTFKNITFTVIARIGSSSFKTSGLNDKGTLENRF